MDKNIYLVGFMGSGKTVVGKLLSEKLNLKFVNMDELIEEREGVTIADIFSLKGEAYFRALEKDILEEVSTLKPCVVSTGGGVVVKPVNIETIKKSGVMIWLDANVDTIYERTKSSAHRPLLNVDDPKKKIQTLLDSRKAFYSQADHTINTSGLSIDEVTEDILRMINGS